MRKKLTPSSEEITKPAEYIEEKKTGDPLAFTNIEGWGAASIKVMKEEKIYNLFQLKQKSPTWLRQKTNWERAKCDKIFSDLTEYLTKQGLITPQIQTATQVLESRLHIKRISSGCDIVDGLLNGGLECGAITELYGENGAGKTQTVHTFCVQVQRPVSEGGLAVEGEAPPMIFFLATENTFRPERIMSIAAGKGLIPDIPEELRNKLASGKVLNDVDQKIHNEIKLQQDEVKGKYLDNIIHCRVTEVSAQMAMIRELVSLAQNPALKLIVVDSGTALFRPAYKALGQMSDKFALLSEMIDSLLKIAEYNKIAIIFVNQIYHDPDAKMGADEDVPYGGNIIGHAIPYRIKVEKSGRYHAMQIKKSPYQANNRIRFDITNAGLAEIQE